MKPYVLALVCAAGLAGVALMTPLGTAAVGLLEVFRVQKFAAVTIDPSKFPLAAAGAAAAGTEHTPDALGAYTGPLKLSKPKSVGTLAAAEAALGTRLASPGASVGGQALTNVYVGEPVDAAYTFDTAKMQAAIDAAGLKGVTAPAQLNNKTFRVHIAPTALAVYGPESGDAYAFGQTQSPWLEVPDGVNMEYLRQDLLTLPGLPPELVVQIQAIKDWKHTLVLPLPPGGQSKETRVAGAPGLLVSDAAGKYHAAFWQRQGVLYVIGGQWSADKALAAAAAVTYP